MTAIQRFAIHGTIMNPHSNGPYVRHEDHLAAMQGRCLAQIEEPAQPVLYVSPGQLANRSNPDGPESEKAGRYLPARVTPTGKFTQPLYAGAAPAAVAPLPAVFEQIAQSWDGCMYDAPGETLDIGADIRAAAKRLLAEHPAAVAPQGEYPHEQMDAMALARYKVVPSHESMLWSHAVVAGDGAQQLYVGREVECQNMARKFAGAFLDGAFAFHSIAAAPALEAPAGPAVPEYTEGGRESVDDALAIVESFGTGIEGLNDEFARQILLAAEVRRLRDLYEQAVNGRSVFRDAYRKVRGAILPPLGCPACDITHAAKDCPQESALAAAPQAPAAPALGRSAAQAVQALQEMWDDLHKSGSPRVNARAMRYYSDALSTVESALLAAPAAPAVDAWLQPDDMAALQRFHETAEDDESYDIGKEAVARLCAFGCLQSHSFGRYSTTDFGDYLLDTWAGARTLPFTTAAERAAQAAAKGADAA